MAGDRIKRDVLALPLAERISLAQTLWDSIDDELTEMSEVEALAEATRRVRELADGTAVGLRREEVMKEVRRKLG